MSLAAEELGLPAQARGNYSSNSITSSDRGVLPAVAKVPLNRISRGWRFSGDLNPIQLQRLIHQGLLLFKMQFDMTGGG